MAAKKLKVNDRVKRIHTPSCHGIVKDIRTEVTATSSEDRDKNIMIQVLWDNGTLSYMGTDALELVKE